MDSNSTVTNARRRVLTAAVSAIAYEAGFGQAENVAVETLTEMLQAFLFEVGRSSRLAAELAGRTEVIVPDLILTLVEMGFNVDSLPAYSKEWQRTVGKLTIPAPGTAQKQTTPKILQTGEKKSHFHYIPDYLPPFPDPHSYIRTLTHKQPVTEYEAIREKSACQKRDVERALTRFMAKTSKSSPSHSLFPDDQLGQLFPLIPLKIQPNAYLHALLPKDQVFDDDDDDEKSSEVEKSSNDAASGDKRSADDSTGDIGSSEQANSSRNIDSEVPDNPYLRTPKISKEERRKKRT